ncbi:hypothetical protein P9112_009087 [Eukaryota sp. TZLM1-RC]
MPLRISQSQEPPPAQQPEHVIKITTQHLQSSTTSSTEPIIDNTDLLDENEPVTLFEEEPLPTYIQKPSKVLTPSEKADLSTLDPMANWDDPSLPHVDRKRLDSARYHLSRSSSPPSAPSKAYWPNRFDITPGPKWDGVVRGNGHEVKVLQMCAEKEFKIIK